MTMVSEWDETGDGDGEPEAVAIIGLAGRFPGARSVEEFWENLRNGVESITTFTDDELLARGVSEETLRDPSYVKASAVLDDVDRFDNDFFGISPGEARITDPQHRVFLETAWEALEDAGCDPRRYDGAIGVYAGAGFNDYIFRLERDKSDPITDMKQVIGNDKDFLATRVAYHLDLRGPSFTIQTASSTSLVAVHVAAQSVLNFECDVALAGGVTIGLPQDTGYYYREGMIESPDGHCRTFDADAQGIVRGGGVGVVVMKRLSDALADGDHIRAVIIGSALNNDGSSKVGYTAPSIDGQAEVITLAQTVADVDPETIGYVEAHGTATALGDPIEVAALTKAFRASTDKTGFCAIGSVKTNVGHLGHAAGVVGLIKAVLTVEHGEIPATLHFKRPNPELDLDNSPFFVNTQLSPWQSEDHPRRATASSFGIGGTNVHVILEQAPPAPLRSGTDPGSAQLLPLSARTGAALERSVQRLRDHAGRHPDADVADIAFTLQEGRSRFDHRRAVVHPSHSALADSLDDRSLAVAGRVVPDASVALLFSGQGTQYVGMGRHLYATAPVFRRELDRCSDLLVPHIGLDLRSVLYPVDDPAAAGDLLQQTWLTQPALFSIEYALARQWSAWGVEPAALAGHSIGEYVAACLAGVFSLEDGLRLVAVRGRLMYGMAPGSMAAVPLPVHEVEELLDPGLSIAAVNGPRATVVSGPGERIDQLAQRLSGTGVELKRLRTSHAFHSAMMDPALEEFREAVASTALRPPQIPIASNVTGSWLSAAEAIDPDYWVNQLRGTVRFADCVNLLAAEPGRLFVEVGPGTSLSTLVRQTLQGGERVVVASLPSATDSVSDDVYLTRSAGRVWAAGVELDWAALRGDTAELRKLPLPTYPFEDRRFWLEERRSDRGATHRPTQGKLADIGEWFWTPSWTRQPWLQAAAVEREEARSRILALTSGAPWESRLIAALREVGHDVREVRAETGGVDERRESEPNRLDPDRPEEYVRILTELGRADWTPDTIIHGWGASVDAGTAPGDDVTSARRACFDSLAMLTAALSATSPSASIHIAVVTSGTQQVLDSDAVDPVKAAALGACRVIPQEHPGLSCQLIDVGREILGGDAGLRWDRLAAEILRPTPGSVIAHRGRSRWIQDHVPLPVADRPSGTLPSPGRPGTYLITGGFGRLGRSFARHLAGPGTRLILLGRTQLPPREDHSRALVEGDERIVDALRTILELEEAGAEVLGLSVDVGDRDQLAGAIAEAMDRFGSIDGVIHAAGHVPGTSGTPMVELGPEEIDHMFRAKVQGALNLWELLEPLQPGFFLLTSSLSSTLGGLRLAAYAGANCVLDALAAHASSQGSACISVNWDAWLRDGDPAQRIGMDVEEGLEAFDRLLSLPDVAQVVVSCAPLRERLEQWVIRSTGVDDPGLDLDDDDDDADASDRPDAPRTKAERTLARIWRELLGVDDVGIHDDYVELGGDSLLGMNVVARAARQGLHFTTQQLLDHPTIAELAQLATAADYEGDTSNAEVGDIPLLPAAARFLGRDGSDRSHWNLCTPLVSGSPIDPGMLDRAAQRLVERHDALRSRFIPDGDRWRQHLGEPSGQVVVEHHDLSSLTSTEQERRLEEIAAAANAGLDIETGPLLRIAHVRTAADEEHVILVVHHLVTDGVAIRVLVTDLEAIYQQLAGGTGGELPAPRLSLRRWAETQRGEASSPHRVEQLGYWTRQPWTEVRPLPVDHPPTPAALSNAMAVARSARLAPAVVEALSKPGVWSAEERLLSALTAAIARWSGHRTVLVERMGHGRTALGPVDPSETVGLLLSYSPVIVRGDAATDEDRLAQIREQLIRAGELDLLRWMSDDETVVALLRDLPRAEVSFNFRGRSSGPLQAGSVFRPGPPGLRRYEHGPQGRRYYPLGVVADIDDDGIEVRFVHSTELHRSQTIERLVALFTEQVDELARPH
jgi:acyl transferase domain-containing protein